MKDEQFELLMKSVNDITKTLKEMKLDQEWEDSFDIRVSKFDADGNPFKSEKFIMTTCEEKQL